MSSTLFVASSRLTALSGDADELVLRRPKLCLEQSDRLDETHLFLDFDPVAYVDATPVDDE